jgi:hypothetical protein
MINCARINERVVAEMLRLGVKKKVVGEAVTIPKDRRAGWIKQIMRSNKDYDLSTLETMSNERLGELASKEAKKEALRLSGKMDESTMGESENVGHYQSTYRLKNEIEHVKGLIKSAPTEDKIKLREILKGIQQRLRKLESKEVKESEDHDEEKEEQEDPTREKLETAKDEADEKKGGPAELAADLRVSIRIEKMGIGRYKRMLTKHELSSDDEEWLKKRIQDLEDCVKAMEAKIPDLEKEAEGKDIKESMVKGIRQAIFELAKG